MILRWLIGLSIALISTTAPSLAAGDLNSGNTLYRICSRDHAGTVDYGVCIGRLEGFVHGYSVASTAETRLVCTPAGSTTGQYLDIVNAYLSAHPERRQLDWSLLVLHALNEAWPCPNGSKIVWDPGIQSIRVLPRK